MLKLIEYHHKYANDFRRLNLEWLEKYDLTESHDLEILDDPEKKILNTGGSIYLAKAGDEIVGSAALINYGQGMFELAKMAVTSSFQGKGISKLLIEKCLETAKKCNAKKIILYSSSKLTTALALYKKYGFRHIDATDSPFVTADVKMELSL
jgi:GNAT superfamily N-acetyltransferase